MNLLLGLITIDPRPNSTGRLLAYRTLPGSQAVRTGHGRTELKETTVFARMYDVDISSYDTDICLDKV